jgi:NAD(P)-dependent dehydrogenase (short-subunit alcohol dehydrogenase family)
LRLKDDNDLDSRSCAIVTGGGGGIGLAVVAALVADGMTVAIADINERAIGDARDRLGSAAKRTIALPFDVSRADQVRSAFDRAWSELGAVHVLVNCAGGAEAKAAVDLDEQEWDAVIGKNLKGAFLCSQAFARRAIAAGTGGRIVNISSSAAEVARPGIAHYSAAKAGINQMTKVLAIELAPHRILVNAVAPGLIGTRMLLDYARGAQAEHRTQLQKIPLARLGTPEEVASAVAYLASPAASYVTGAILNVDGGYRLGIAGYTAT